MYLPRRRLGPGVARAASKSLKGMWPEMQMALFWNPAWLAAGAFVIFALAVMEVAYRIRLKIKLNDRPNKTEITDSAAAIAEGRSFWVMSMARELTDLTLGYRYRQGTHVYRTVHFVRGRFDHWDEHTFRADRPEVSGALDDDFNSAELKILVFGNSFTAIQAGFGTSVADGEGLTWPRLLQERLEQRHRTSRSHRQLCAARTRGVAIHRCGSGHRAPMATAPLCYCLHHHEPNAAAFLVA